MSRTRDRLHQKNCAQLDSLEELGLLIDDRAKALEIIQHLNIYRLKPYWTPLIVDQASPKVRIGTKFSSVVSLYEFDRLLRIMVLECIERVEVSIRSTFIDAISTTFGSHGHYDLAHARNAEVFADIIGRHDRELQRSRNGLLQIPIRNNLHIAPPVWESCEMMSFGTLTKWIKCVLKWSLVNDIASIYDLQGSVLVSWLHHLNVTRNVAAHHGRLWNRSMTILPKMRVHNAIRYSFETSTRKIYNTLVILQYLRNIIEPDHRWKTDLVNLIDRYDIDTALMGFPKDWQDREVWRRG